MSAHLSCVYLCVHMLCVIPGASVYARVDAVVTSRAVPTLITGIERVTRRSFTHAQLITIKQLYVTTLKS